MFFQLSSLYYVFMAVKPFEPLHVIVGFTNKIDLTGRMMERQEEV